MAFKMSGITIYMQLSENGIRFIHGFEGCKLEVYKDIAGYPTIGWGHLIAVGEKYSKITQAEADSLFIKDSYRFVVAVNKLVVVPINQNQFDALVSFAFNLGVGALQKSTLLKKLNNRDYVGAAAEFQKWNRAGGKISKGLTRRRLEEAKLFAS